MNKTIRPLSLQKRTILKSNLQYGDYQIIADLAETDRTTVWRWFKGNSDNPQVQKAVEAFLKRREEKLSEKIEAL